MSDKAKDIWMAYIILLSVSLGRGSLFFKQDKPQNSLKYLSTLFTIKTPFIRLTIDQYGTGRLCHYIVRGNQEERRSAGNRPTMLGTLSLPSSLSALTSFTRELEMPLMIRMNHLSCHFCLSTAWSTKNE